jgi:hypothetical protein
MTKPEFLAGFKLLLIQPWGWRYNQIGHDGKPTPDALAQMEFYYTELSWAHPQAWAQVARTYAKGEKWPSVQELLTWLRHVNVHYVQAITDAREPEYCECPAEVSAMLDKLCGDKAFSFSADQRKGSA